MQKEKEDRHRSKVMCTSIRWRPTLSCLNLWHGITCQDHPWLGPLRMEKSQSGCARTAWCVVNMFHKNGMSPLTRTHGTIFNPVLYCNLRALQSRLKYVYSVISVIVNSLSGNTKNQGVDPFVVWIFPFFVSLRLGFFFGFWFYGEGRTYRSERRWDSKWSSGCSKPNFSMVILGFFLKGSCEKRYELCPSKIFRFAFLRAFRVSSCREQAVPGLCYMNWWIVVAKTFPGNQEIVGDWAGLLSLRAWWQRAQIGGVLQSNTNAQRMLVLSHRLRSVWGTLGQDCWRFPRSL